MPDFKEIKLDEAKHLINANHLIESKIDGCCMEWKNQEFRSERNCERSDRFPHIIKELKSLPWNVQGEIAIPFGNVFSVSRKANWHKAKLYLFGISEYDGSEVVGNPLEIRKELERLVGKNFKHITLPFKWDDFSKAWRWVKKHEVEGLVFKSLIGGIDFKLKDWKEFKVPVIGHTAGLQKGSFQIACESGAVSSVSATSVEYVDRYNHLVASGKAVWMEGECLFLTDEGKPFQPRIRRIDVKSEILKVA